MLGFQNTKTLLLKDTLKMDQKKFFVIKIKDTVPWMVSRLLKIFMKKNCIKLVKKKFRIEKVLKRKDDKLFVKWKGDHNSFNSWIDKKDIE